LIIFWQQYFNMDYNHIYMCISTTRMMWKILQQHKEFALTCEGSIFCTRSTEYIIYTTNCKNEEFIYGKVDRCKIKHVLYKLSSYKPWCWDMQK
jgi:hypothetical protein